VEAALRSAETLRLPRLKQKSYETRAGRTALWTSPSPCAFEPSRAELLKKAN
jgi:hypothetical protein